MTEKDWYCEDCQAEFDTSNECDLHQQTCRRAIFAEVKYRALLSGGVLITAVVVFKLAQFFQFI